MTPRETQAPKPKVELWIEDVGHGKRLAMNTKVSVVERAADGTEVNRSDISNLVRAIDLRLHVGEAITCNLECFVNGGISVEAGLIDKLRTIEIKPRRKTFGRRLRDVTGFRHRWRIYA